VNRRRVLVLAGMASMAAVGNAVLARTRDNAPAPVPTRFGMLPVPPPPIQPAVLPEHLRSVPGLSLGEFHGFSCWIVNTPHASAAISVFGGQVLSFVPHGGEDLFWRSPTPSPLPTPIRGGVPVCWPYFARQGQTSDQPSHGLVRTLTWELHDARREDDGALSLTLAPPVIDSLPLRLMMRLRIGPQLEQALVTDNISDEEVVFTQALHNYFRVSDALLVDVDGLDGRTYFDKFDDGREYRQHGTWNLRDPRDPGRSDRMYTDTAGRYVLRDHGGSRSILMTTEGSRSAVLWNPGEIIAQQLADVGPGWREYVALEAANVGPDLVALPAGGQHVLKQTIVITSAYPAHPHKPGWNTTTQRRVESMT